MRACNKCLENNWSYKKEDDKSITAICYNCGYEVNFPMRIKEKMKEGDKCRNCDGIIIKQESKFKQKKLLKPYYFTASLYCHKCKTRYMAEEFKVYNNNFKNL